MIPKEGKDPMSVSGWRLITVGSALARLFSGVLEGRIRKKVDLCKLQYEITPRLAVLA